MSRRIFVLGLGCQLAAGVFAADWNEHRGPGRDGRVVDSPPLMNQWPTQGLVKVWQSEEKFPADDAGGYGSVSVADGKVFCIYTPIRVEKIATRMLSGAKLRSLGWSDRQAPADLQAQVEAARTSPARQALKDGKEIQAWVKAWGETNLTAEVRKIWLPFVADRLTKGDAALPLPLLDSLATIQDKVFPGQAELDQWLDAHDCKGEVRNKVLAAIPVEVRTRDNVTICLDAANGKTLWKRVLPGGEGTYGTACTPCVMDGKVYGFGEGRTVFCLSAATGEVVWSVEVPKAAEKQCSFIVEDGVAVAPIDPLTGFDAASGKILWTNAVIGSSWSSPVRWRNEGKTFVIVRGTGKVACVEPRTGATLWVMNDNGGGHTGSATPTIDGDRMVLTGSDVRTYKLSREKPELLATVTMPMDYSPGATTLDRHAYIWSRKGGACISLETGQLVWTNAQLIACSYSAAVCADGKMFIGGAVTNSGYGDNSLTMFLPSPEKGARLGQSPVRMVLCTSPAIADGRAYCRLKDGVACFELKK